MKTKPAARTKLVRVRADLADMMSALNWHDRLSAPDFLDPLIRRAIEERFIKLPKAVRDRALTNRTD